MMFDSIKNKPQPIQKYLKTVGGYDAPLLMLISIEDGVAPYADRIFAGLNSVMDPDDVDDVEAESRVVATETLYFVADYSEHDIVLKMLDKIKSMMDEENRTVHISAFRHNCLGDIEETYSWACLLLEETKQEFGDKSGYKINDFENIDTWPGLEKYRPR